MSVNRFVDLFDRAILGKRLSNLVTAPYFAINFDFEDFPIRI